MDMASIYDYEAVIGLEVHIQLCTKSKAFCGDDASFGGLPNAHVSTISLAHPGTLPRPNEKQIEYAIRLGLALGSEISPNTLFDRKHYFYADLPKGFQTTQDLFPICIGGSLRLDHESESRDIRIHHIHMEEDAGKSIHHLNPEQSLLDFNRAGVPLLELVTEPDLRSADDVYLFINKIRQLARYLEISDGNMEEGSLRCDVNVSLRKKGENVLNNRCEIKNVNSARYAKKAVEYEIDRQYELYINNQSIAQQTREFIPEQNITRPLRGKEHAHDYRYFPEPDLPPIQIRPELIEKLRLSQPTLPKAWKNVLISKFSLSPYEANIIIEQKAYVLYFENLITKHDINPKPLSNLLINKMIPYCQEQALDIKQFPLKVDHIKAFLRLIQDGKITSSIAYQTLWPSLIDQPGDVLDRAQSLNILQTRDEDQITRMVVEILNENPDQVQKYIGGKKSIIGFFMGQLMRKSNGKANPKIAKAIIEKQLEQIKSL